MNKPLDLSHIYLNREDFIVIGITGRTGSGCSLVSDLFSKPSLDDEFPPIEQGPLNNDDRKYKIAHNFLEENWKPFYVLNYSKILSLIVYSEKLGYIEDLFAETLGDFSKDYGIVDLEAETRAIVKLQQSTDFVNIELEKQPFSIDESASSQTGTRGKSQGFRDIDLFNFFDSHEFLNFHKDFHSALRTVNEQNRILILHNLCNNQRKGGCYHCVEDSTFDGIYSISKIINRIIKGYRKAQKMKDLPCRVIIDSLRNPLEIMFFKERFSAFYTLAINPNEKVRIHNLKKKYTSELEAILRIDAIEYGDRNNRTEFYKQNVQECIQKSDLHLSFLDNTEYPYSLKQQIVIFYSLMLHPGLITPTPQERVMQIAYTAKYNSGCISRQVGAVITDKNFVVKAIGWNNTPEKQTPCLLRSAEDLLNDEDKEAFSVYEKKEDSPVKKELQEKWNSVKDKSHLKGHNCSFCFKDFQNSITEGKNQVHTRSLHAEENAMLQITKYGGQGIEGGILFTTASPCELCSKKAYQLGIEKIVYIDPYPGIAQQQILAAGTRDIDLLLFTGAIGKAYHRLYEPFMAHKDEIYIRTGMAVENKVKSLENENKRLKAKLEEMESSGMV